MEFFFYYTINKAGFSMHMDHSSKIFFHTAKKYFCLYKNCFEGNDKNTSCINGGNNVKILDKIALILVIIGALNWGAVGLFGFDCVAFLCGGQMAVLSRVIYSLVGIAGLWCITLLFREDPSSSS